MPSSPIRSRCSLSAPVPLSHSASQPGHDAGSDALFAMSPWCGSTACHQILRPGMTQAQGSRSSTAPSTLVRARVGSGIPPTPDASREGLPLRDHLQRSLGLTVAGTPYGPSVATTPRTSVAFPAVQGTMAGFAPQWNQLSPWPITPCVEAALLAGKEATII